MQYFLVCVLAALLHISVLSVGGANAANRQENVGVETMLGVPLPAGFEPTRNRSGEVYLLNRMCGESYEGPEYPSATGELVEAFDYENASGADEELVEEILALLIDEGYRKHYVFDQFLEDYAIMLVTVISPTGKDLYYLLFDYGEKLFHPVGPCPMRQPELPEAP